MNYLISKLHQKRQNNEGFTLTELIIVLMIIAFLVLMIVFMTRKWILKGKDARREGDIRHLQTAIEEYQNDKNCYPLPQLVTCEPGSGLQPYLETIPCDPVTQASYFYDYENSACPKWYRIYAKLDDTTGLAGLGPNGAYNYSASSPNAPDPNLSDSDFYGCKGGTCVPIYWDSSRPGPECDPNSRSTNCDGICGPPVTECKPWNQ